MKLIVGLGNLGDRYKNTRHNIGFMVVDALLGELSCEQIKKETFKGELYKSTHALLLKPQTFMNLSGESVQKVAHFYKIETKDIVVIHDELDIPFGAIRFKLGGGHGGHNGLKSIDAYVGAEYIRVRVGIGKPLSKDEVSDYVLSPFSKEQQESLKSVIDSAKSASEHLLKGETLESVSARFTKKG